MPARRVAVTTAEQTFADGTRPQVLDIVEIPLDVAIPQVAQPENWRLAAGPWTRAGRMDQDKARLLLKALLLTTPVFGTNAKSMPVADVPTDGMVSSLAVVRPERLRWRKQVWPERSRVRAVFEHAGTDHDLPLTDPSTVASLAQAPIGDHEPNADQEIFLVVSLGEPYEEQHWKLVAGVIAFPGESGRTSR